MIDRPCRAARFLAGLMMATTLIPSTRGDDFEKKPVAALPAMDQLPTPFVFLDGSPVSTPADWTRRRDELKALFEAYEYGHLPPKPDSMIVTLGVSSEVDGGTSLKQDWEVMLEQAERKLVLHVRLTWPKKATGRLPVVIRPGVYPGARPLVNDPASREKASPPPPRADDSRVYLDRGIAVAEFDPREVAADDKDRFPTSGVLALFDGKLDSGALMAWAWGFHRVIDALETEERIDPNRVIVTGHSRYGKAALVAGAFDDRIALTAPNHSGAGGAAPYRYLYGKSEALSDIVGRFPFWFRSDFAQFVGQVKRLPVDQHELRALVAPRAFLATEGTNDPWSNPEGSQLAHQAALKVYHFLGVPDRIGIRFRPVGHVVTSEDVADFADHLFFGKPLPDDFGKLAYPIEPSGFSWDAPRSHQADTKPVQSTVSGRPIGGSAPVLPE